ncbi:hypothetical protein M0Q28_05555 [Patescibacteria group bacterium]|jgi:hypothetical protein|nr:hypothetical protein [Patescibacteria group bacterium]
MKKSIVVSITGKRKAGDDNNEIVYEHEEGGSRSPHVSSMTRFFGEMPKPPYKVTYKLDDNGPFKLRCGCMTDIKKLTKSGGWSRYSSFRMCIFPNDWDGLRVSRKVTPIRKVKK